MKKTLLFISLILLIGSCDPFASTTRDQQAADQPILEYDGIELVKADTSNVPPAILDQYRADAGILAVRYIREHDSTRITIPETLIDIFFHGLVHIHKSGAEKVEQVIGEHELHKLDSRVTKRQLLYFDPLQAWTQQWKDGKRFTGNADIDGLIKKYDLELKEYLDFQTTHNDAAVLVSADPLNQEALGRRFEELDEIDAAGPDVLTGSGKDIRAEVGKGNITYGFVKGWGDCPSGCINHHYWIYRVNEYGEVTLAQSYGDPLP